MRVMIVRDGSVADAARMTDRISASLCLQDIRSCHSSSQRSLKHTEGRRKIMFFTSCCGRSPLHLASSLTI